MKIFSKASFTSLAIALLFLSQRAEAGIVVDIVEASDGNSVTINASGTLTFAAFEPNISAGIGEGLRLKRESSSTGIMQYLPSNLGAATYAQSSAYGSADFSNWNGDVNGGSPASPVTNISGESGFGWRFLSSNILYIYGGYVSGTQYDSTATVAISNSTVTDGSYATYTMTGGDTVRFQYSVASSSSAVPEPSTAIAMGLLGIVGFAGNRRRRRQGSVA